MGREKKQTKIQKLRRKRTQYNFIRTEKIFHLFLNSFSLLQVTAIDCCVPTKTVVFLPRLLCSKKNCGVLKKIVVSWKRF